VKNVSDDRKLLRSPEAAALLKMPISTFEKKTARREIPVVKIGRSVYFDTADLWAWIDSKKVGKAPSATGAAV
jgi:excisionase family DNA binding protein